MSTTVCSTAQNVTQQSPQANISNVIDREAPPPSDDIAQVVNWAYRGKHPEKDERSWTTERHLISGVRTTTADVDEMLRRCQEAGPEKEQLLLAFQPEAGEADGSAERLVGTVNVQRTMLEGYATPRAEIGFFSVDPDQQGEGIGNRLLAAAEDAATWRMGATHSYMWVISVRDDIIAWYQRKGYQPTGETAPFPETEDDRFGKPIQPLHFVRLEKSLRS